MAFLKKSKKRPSGNAAAEKTDQALAEAELLNLRMIINKLDDLIIQSVARRMVVSRTIGMIKKQQKLKVKDAKREKELQKIHQQLAKNHGITYGTLKKIFDLIMKESRRQQK
ncbi:MAG: chorismate mutase [Candidatus Gracilibacteria bacterium]